MKLIKAVNGSYINIDKIQNIYTWNEKCYCSTDEFTCEIPKETYNLLIDHYARI